MLFDPTHVEDVKYKDFLSFGQTFTIAMFV